GDVGVNCDDVDRVELGKNEEVGAGDPHVEPLNGEDVAAGLEDLDPARDVEVFEVAGVVVFWCARVPVDGGGDIGGRDGLAVQVRDKAIVVPHAKPEKVQCGGVGDLKRHADVNACVDAQHIRPDVGPQRAECRRGGSVTNARGTVLPGRVVE